MNASQSSDFCDLPTHSSIDAACAYVLANSDLCEGGGYITWTALVICEQHPAIRTVITVAGALFCLFLFLALAVVADDFFSPNVTDIVHIFSISPNIAGVTLMALGNGVTDVLTSVVSVTGSQTPKPGFAIGAVLGGACFLSMIVCGSVAIVHPLRVMRRPIMRDLAFFLLAIIWTGVTFSVTTHLSWWQPAGLLIIYVLYASTVASGRFFFQCLLKREEKKQISMSASTLPATGMQAEDKVHFEETNSFSRHRPNFDFSPDQVQVPDDDEDAESATYVDFRKDADLTHEFGLAAYQRSEKLSTSDLPLYATETSARVYPGEGAFARSVSMWQTTIKDSHKTLPTAKKFDRSVVGTYISRFLKCLLSCLNPMNVEEWHEAKIFSKMFMIIKIPVVIIYKLTVPLSSEPWCQPMSLIHCFSCPLLILICFQILTSSPFVNGPPLYALALALGAIMAVILLMFTRLTKEPRFYKVMAAMIGFVIAAVWVYFISAELISALTMLGIISTVPQEVIGLTVAAWCNNVGDLVGDIAVAKRGVPRMAFTATIAAPLFNLLIGFGVPFLIVTTKSSTPIDIDLTTVSRVLLIFLTLSVVSSMILLPLQKWQAGRFYGAYLFTLYFVFIVVVILAALKIVRF